MAKMTPGPWGAGERVFRDAAVESGDVDCFYVVVHSPDGEIAPARGCADNEGEAIANARAIACLPELVEAARAFAEVSPNGGCTSCGCQIAREGYCGCAPLEDAVLDERRVALRRILARIDGEGA